MPEKQTPPILDLPWDILEGAHVRLRRILVNWQEFYVVDYAGNLLLTPEEVKAAHLRFTSYPNIERTFPIWILSESEIKGVAERFGLNIEGVDPDLIAYHFKKGFMPMVEIWDEVLKKAIEQAITEKAIQN
jgi:hypothetical protein